MLGWTLPFNKSLDGWIDGWGVLNICITSWYFCKIMLELDFPESQASTCSLQTALRAESRSAVRRLRRATLIGAGLGLCWGSWSYSTVWGEVTWRSRGHNKRDGLSKFTDPEQSAEHTRGHATPAAVAAATSRFHLRLWRAGVSPPGDGGASSAG